MNGALCFCRTRDNVLFLLGLLLAALPATSNAQFYYFTNNGAITISGYAGPGGVVTVPDSINGWPVTAIYAGVFQNNTTLRSIILPDSMLNIGTNAFYGCLWLTNAVLGTNLAYIGPWAFRDCHQLRSADLPGTLQSIGAFAFYGCNNLENLALGTNLVYLGSSAFQNCSWLSEVNIPNSLTNISSSAFASCSSVTDLVLGSRVRVVGSSAFQSCSMLAKVLFPASVTNLGSSAFASCTRLTAALFTTNAPAADATVFSGDTKATAYYVAGTSGWSGMFCGIPTTLWHPPSQCAYRISGGAIQIASYLGSRGAVVIPGSINGTPVTSIGAVVFQNAAGVTSVTLPASLAGIGGAAFSGSGLINVFIPAGVTNIGFNAFANCASLPAISVDAANPAYTSLEGVLFDKSLGTLIQCPGGKTGSCPVPATVTNIATSALSPCLLLTSIDVDPLNTIFSSLDGVLFNPAQDTLLRFPQGKPGAYTVPASVTDIADYAFASSTALTSLVVGDNVLTLGGQAFEGCAALTNAVIGNGVTVLSPFAFNACGNLASVTLGTNVTRLGSAAFQLCGKLATVNLPGTLTVIDSWVFNQCRSLPAINIPNVVSIGDYAFNLCQALHGLYLPSLATLGVDVFGGCTNLATVTFGPGLTYLPDWTFNSCQRLTSVFFYGNCPGFGSYVFSYANTPTIYYLPGATGWGATFIGVPTALWRPSLQSGGPGFGVQDNQFGFNISWAAGQTVVVEACGDLSSPVWVPVSTNTLATGSTFFRDPDYPNYQTRSYRVRSP